jgi:ATP-binding cassette, subfamily F, member 3
MGQLFVNAITKYFGAEMLLDNITFTVGSEDRFGLVGSNGCGKTTLLKIIMSELESDQGKISFEGKSTVGYFSQNQLLDVSINTMIDYMWEGFKDTVDTWNKMMIISKNLEKDPTNKTLINQLSRVQAEFDSKDGFETEHRIKRILTGLGFSKSDWNRPISSLSGGERSRLQLSRVLAGNPNTIILDEPTNHLDLKSVMWLEEFLSSYGGSVLIVSHDRFLLDRICNKIGFIENRKIKVFNGNYSKAKSLNELEKSQQAEEAIKQREFLAKADQYVNKFKRIGTPKALAKARQMESRVKRIEIIEEPEKEKDISLTIESSGRTGEVIFKTDNLEMSFDQKTLFKNVNLTLRRGQKVAIIGPNGSGKTTFLKLILGDLDPTNGSIWSGYNVAPVYLEQELANFNANNSVLDEIMYKTELHIPEARNHLARFHFKGDDVFKKCNVLSGGEISRLILSKLALIESNFLIMDEPTNHLDIKARTAIEETLVNYNGTVLIVSHDRYFVKQINARIWHLNNRFIQDTRMQLDEFLKSKNDSHNTEDNITNHIKSKQQSSNTLSKNRVREIKNRISAIESRLSELSAEQKTLESHMSGSSTDDLTTEDYKRYNEIQKEEQELMKQWEDHTTQLEQ